MEGKKTKGRQKIEMKYIENNDARLISFSKRKAGLLKKASEISNLCGAHVGLLLYSPAGKPFTFGNPSIEEVMNRFLKGEACSMDPLSPILEAHRIARMESLNHRHNELAIRVAAAKERKKSLKQIEKAIKDGNEINNVPPAWWEMVLDELDQPEIDRVAEEIGMCRDRIANGGS